MHIGLALLSLVASVCWAGCGNSGAPGGGMPTGGGCQTSAQCSGGICDVSSDFPGGYCTEACSMTDPASCPIGSVCINDASGAPPGVSAVCYQSCHTNADCLRPGYACLEKANYLVCRN